MQTLRVALGGRGYPIHVGHQLLDREDLLAPHLAGRRAAVVTNPVVAPLYLDRVGAALRRAGSEPMAIVVPDGEDHKDWTTLERIHDALLEARCGRDTVLVALGGGVLGDVAGFAAATYQRGIPFIQVPTTLLAQVDSSVGGKTAINHPRGKNMIGAFHQPLAVVADTDTLATLPPRELRAGLAEVVKHGLVQDAAFFAWLEQQLERLLAGDAEALAHAIVRSVEIKAAIVARDETETGDRALLNLGHTFGHAIEAGLGFGVWLHGEAVGAGLVMAADLSARLGRLDGTAVERIARLVARAGLPVRGPDLGAETYIRLMRLDKKAQGGRMRFIVLDRIGAAAIDAAVPEVSLLRTLAERTAEAPVASS
jgi:3-dehydroquinate synthase